MKSAFKSKLVLFILVGLSSIVVVAFTLADNHRSATTAHHSFLQRIESDAKSRTLNDRNDDDIDDDVDEDVDDNDLEDDNDAGDDVDDDDDDDDARKDVDDNDLDDDNDAAADVDDDVDDNDLDDVVDALNEIMDDDEEKVDHGDINEIAGGDNDEEKDDDVSISSISADEEGLESRFENFQDTAWAIHGFLMALSWGLLAPVAIGSSLLRSLLGGPLWFKIHQYLQLSVLCLTSIAFVLAVINVQLDDGPSEHFDESHKLLGLVIFFLLLLQVASGLFRPHLPHSLSSAPNDSEASSIETTSEQGSEQNLAPSANENVGSLVAIQRETTKEDETVNDARIGQSRDLATDSASAARAQARTEAEATVKGYTPRKSPQRWFFEIQHRIIGALLVGLAWYNCTLGINEEFEETSARLVFWIVVGTVCFAVLFLRMLVQLKIVGRSD